MKKIILLFSLLILLLPILQLVGLSDRTPNAGSVNNYAQPQMRIRAFLKNSFQKDFENYWQVNFNFRNFALRTKNQLYDWFNFGQFHSGFSGEIIQGKNFQLFQKGYINYQYYYIFDEEKNERLAKNLAKLQSYMPETKIFVVMCPSKPEIYPELVPLRYRLFKKTNGGSFENLEEKFNVYDVPYIRAAKLFENTGQKLFPYSGAHWNYFGAGVTALETINSIYDTNITVKDITYNKDPLSSERDLASLLNVWIPYKRYFEPYPELFFSETDFKSDKIIIIGDSFTNEFRKSIDDMNIFRQVVQFENLPISIDDVKTITSKPDLIVFAYWESILSSFPQRVEMLCDYFENKLFFKFTQNYTALKTNGLSYIEPWGRWTDGAKASLQFNVQPSEKDLLVDFTLKPYLHKKSPVRNVEVYVNKEKLADWKFESNDENQIKKITVPSRLILDDGSVLIEFNVLNAVSPRKLQFDTDARKLGIGLIDMKVSQ